MTAPGWKIQLFTAVALLLAGFLPTAAADCPLTSPSPLPAWSSSGAWQTADTVAFVDTTKGKVLRYSVSGRALGSVPGLSESLRPFVPRELNADDGGYLLQLRGNRFVRMTGALRQGDRPVLMGGADIPEDGEALRAVFAWDVAGGDLVVCGDVELGDGNWRHGYLRAPLSGRGQDIEFLREFARDDPIRVYCRSGLDLIATQGSIAFVLLMDEEPKIIRFEPDGTERVLATELGSRPTLSFERRADFPRMMSVIEESTMPSGLYAWQNDLFVLSRAPGEQGTEWTLLRVDSENGELLGSGLLPTNANHLTVVPGPEYWAFLERGSVRGIQDHEELFGIRYVPSGQIRSLDSMGERLCQ